MSFSVFIAYLVHNLLALVTQPILLFAAGTLLQTVGDEKIIFENPFKNNRMVHLIQPLSIQMKKRDILKEAGKRVLWTIPFLKVKCMSSLPCMTSAVLVISIADLVSCAWLKINYWQEILKYTWIKRFVYAFHVNLFNVNNTVSKTISANVTLAFLLLNLNNQISVFNEV